MTLGGIVLEMDENGNIVSFNSVSGGNIDYWTSAHGSDRKGKIKSIGDMEIIGPVRVAASEKER